MTDQNEFQPAIAGFVLAGAHTALIIYITILILSGTEPDWPMYWILFLFVDFPSGLFMIPLMSLFHGSANGPLHDLGNFWVPLIGFTIVGALQWYVIGWILEFFYKNLRKTPATTNKTT
jgi:hypothetical protein